MGWRRIGYFISILSILKIISTSLFTVKLLHFGIIERALKFDQSLILFDYHFFSVYVEEALPRPTYSAKILLASICFLLYF